MKENVLGVLFDVIDRKTATDQVMHWMASEGVYKVVTPNPEIVMAAQVDDHFKSLINHSDLVLADGIGVLLASKISKGQLEERVEGCDLVYRLLEGMADTKQTVYFLGGKPTIANLAQAEILKKHPTLNVIGTHHGYYAPEDELALVNDIKTLSPDLLLLALGSPRQEVFMDTYGHLFEKIIMIGVGGTLDVMSGQLNRAPKWMRKIGLEWFHRLLLEPSRIKRMWIIPKFLIKVIQRR